MLKPSKRSNILSIIHNPNNDQFGPSPPPFIWMSDVLISITFNLGNVGITRKVYEVSPLMHMRMFKSIVANDLSANYAINLKPLHNYGFIRPYDSRFLADHEQVGTLTFGSELPNNAIFTLRCRNEYPLEMSRKKIKQKNGQKARSKFLHSIEKGDLSGAEKILIEGLDPNFFDPETGETPLMKWLKMKTNLMPRFLETLIEYGVHFDLRDNNGKCVIHYATETENRAALKLLVANGVSLHEWDDKGVPALFYAAENDVHVGFFEFVLDLNRCPNNNPIRDKNWINDNNRISQIGRIFETTRVDEINRISEVIRTSKINQFTETNQINEVKRIYETKSINEVRRINDNSSTNQNSRKCEIKRMNEARRISEAGQINSGHIDRETNENLKIVDISNNNILHHVVRKGLANHLAAIIKHLSKLSKSEVIRLFSAKNSSGNTPVHICVLQTNKTCLLMLSRLKICHLVTNSTGDCALDLAIKICDTDLVNILKNVNNFSNMEISDVRSKTLTYRQSLQHCLTYANTLRCRRSGDRIFRPYPPILKVSKSFTFKEFEITEGDCVFVYIVLMTKVAYGYKVLSENRIFAWFPSECVGLSSRRQISEWQKEHASLSNLIINIPELPTLNQTGGLPLMLFLNLGLKETNVGLEIGQRKLKEQDLAIPSPFYVRNVVIDSPADVCGLRVGDSIIYIMSNEITSFSLRIVKTIFKKMLRSKPPADLPTTTIRQICLMILRQNDPIFLSDDHDDVMSEYFTLNNNSPIETLGSLSYDINPKFFLNSTFDGQTMKRNRRESYNKPLPEIPSSAKNNNLEVPQNENTECSTSLSSISNLPPPSCDMDED